MKDFETEIKKCIWNEYLKDNRQVSSNLCEILGLDEAELYTINQIVKRVHEYGVENNLLEIENGEYYIKTNNSLKKIYNEERIKLKDFTKKILNHII